MEGVGRPLRIVGRIDARVAGRREPVPGGLAGAGRTDVGHDELLAVDPDPDPLADELVRHRVAGRPEADRRLLVDDPGHAEGDGVRLVGHRVEPLAFVRQLIDRRPAGLAVLASIDLLAERVARGPQLGERPVFLQEVRLGRDEVGLGDLDRALRAALRRRIGRHAGVDLEAVMARGGDEDRVLDGDAGDPVDRDGPLVVRQRVRRTPAEAAERLVETGDDRWHGSVPGRDDDAEPTPGQPCAPQQRLPAADPGTLAPVELKPHAGLRDPRPEDPPMSGRICLLGSSDSPASRSLGAIEAECQQLVVDDVGADLAVAALDPLLDLGHVRIDQLAPSDRLG